MLILFEEDWDKYPRAIVDRQCRNKSVLETCWKLKEMGVKNHLFPLALHNPALEGLDPHSPNLTIQQKAAIGMECDKNFFYLARAVFKAPPTGADVAFNRANAAFWWLFFNNIIPILTMPRQNGKSFAANVLYCALMGFLCRGTNINVLTKDDSLRVENLEGIKALYEELPPYLNMRLKDDTSSSSAFAVGRLKNRFNVRVPSASEVGANKVGRGIVSPVWGVDEAPFQPHIGVAVPALAGSMGAAIQISKAAGRPWGLLFTTTAGRIDDPSGEWMYNYVQDSALFTNLFYDAKNKEELTRMVVGYSRARVPRVYCAFSYKQLGKTDEWAMEELQRKSGTAAQANQDLFNVWTNGTGNSPLDAKILTRLVKSVVPETSTVVMGPENYIVRWYIKEKDIEPYMANNDTVLALDTSDAGGRDAIGFTLTDVRTGDIIAVTAISLTNLHNFSQFITEFLVKYLRVTLIPERKNSAITLIDTLLIMLPQHGVDPVARIFNWVVNDPIEYKQVADEFTKPFRRRDPECYVRAKTAFGFATAGTGRSSRSELYSTTLQSCMSMYPEKLRDRQIIEQVTGLIIKNNRVDHQTNGHDDLVICVLLTHWFLTSAKNLIRYGIDPANVLVHAKPVVQKRPDDYIVDHVQTQLRQQIENMLEQIKNESDENVVARLESQLRGMFSRLVLREGETLTLDQMLTELRQKRKLNRVMGFRARTAAIG
jgi:hypothetical protein